MIGQFAAALGVSLNPASADTMEWALAQAYINNPALNSQRAALRAADESVPQALSGYRPTFSTVATAGTQYTNFTQKGTDPNTGVTTFGNTAGEKPLATVGAGLSQTIFNGFQTANKTRGAESQVSAARAQLQLTEQSTLLNAATAYINLLRDSAILALQRRNVDVLKQQLGQTRDRFQVGDVTQTDLYQAQTRLAGAQSAVLAAEASYGASRAVYRQVVGIEPGQLAAASPVDRFAPPSAAQAVAMGRAQHPAVMGAQFTVDAALFAVKINESALYPTVALQANASHQFGSNSAVTITQSTSAFFGTQATIPIYQGGGEYATIRQAKETLGQRRHDLDVARDQVQTGVLQAWSQLVATKGEIQSTERQVAGAEGALNGVRQEALVGQRTTLDVLNAEQELVQDRIALVTAQRDRIVASYTLVSAIGRLTMEVLGLTNPYDPIMHYQQVRDAWTGVRTPDGR